MAVLVVWGLIDDSSSALPPPATQEEQLAQQVSLAPAFSLPTGTVLKKNPAYMQGDGELTISNGTQYDAVAKLITNGSSGTSVFTVYVKAHDDYVIKNILDGSYRLAFAQGSNWDSASKEFTRDESFSSFDDAFDYETTSTQFTTYSITLNAVDGGTAETSAVDPNQFAAY